MIIDLAARSIRLEHRPAGLALIISREVGDETVFEEVLLDNVPLDQLLRELEEASHVIRARLARAA